MAYDPKCNELAEYFLPATAPKADKEGLSQAIQDSVETWLNDNSYGPEEVETDTQA